MPDYRIIVDLSDHMLYLLDGNQVIKGYPVGTGKMLTQTPNGEFTIVNKQSNPGGPFGVLWMGLSAPIMAYTEPMSLGLLANPSPMVVYACTTRMYWICLPKFL